jgi:ABC-type sugar transport system substrate-binding protein
MKRYLHVTIVLLIVFILLLTGCGKSTPVPPTVEKQQVLETAAPTVSPTPEITITPTEAPPTPEITITPTEAPPIPCTIIFDTDRDGNREIYRMAPDGSQLVNLTNNPAYDVEPAWSPDGSQIAFVSNRPQKQQEGGNYLYVMEADGSNVRQLTFENESASPDWSHDGSQITYSNKGDIYIIKADGSGQSINLTNSPERDEQPTWSPDGSQIAWLSGDDGKWNIFVMNADGSHVLHLTENGQAYDVTWTIDGEIFSHWNHPDGICSKCVMGADGSNARDAGGKGELQRFMPFRTLDGDRVECISGDINTGNEEIYLVGEIYPDIFLNLTNNPGNDRNPDWPANCLAGFEGVIPDESAVPEPEPTDPQNELVLGYAGDDPSQWQRKNNFQKACDELGIQCVYGKIPDLLNQDVSAIVLNSSPETIKSDASAIREARGKGISVFVLDAEMDGDGIYSVVTDRSEMMSVTLKNLLKESGGSGDFAFFDFDPAQKDTAIIRDILEKEYPKIKVVTTDTKRYNFKEDEYIFNDLTVAFPALKAVWTNAGINSVVFGVVNNISDPENYPLVACEPTKTGLYIWIDRVEEHPGFQCVAVSNPPGIAYDAVYIAYYMVSGEKIDESTLKGQYGNAFMVDFPVITNENLAKWMDIINYEKDDFVADQLMTPEEIKDKWFQ